MYLFMSEAVTLLLLLLLLWEFFTPALIDDFPLESEWQQVSTPYFGRFQKVSSLDGLLSSSYFQFLLSLYQFFDDCTERTNYNWYQCHYHVIQLFQFSSKV